MLLIMINMCFDNCQPFRGSFQTFTLSDLSMDMTDEDFKERILNTVRNHFEIIDTNTYCSQLLFTIMFHNYCSQLCF